MRGRLGRIEAPAGDPAGASPCDGDYTLMLQVST
jgi:hypothetical protein